MKVVTVDDGHKAIAKVQGHSIFLCGPTPRSPDVPSWRPKALQLLRELGYTGTVFVPEQKEWKKDYYDQVTWEKQGLQKATVVAFWVPREMKDMPALTTNVEFGRHICFGRVVYGRPDKAPKNKYLDWMYQDITGKKPTNSLKSLLQTAISIHPKRVNVCPV